MLAIFGSFYEDMFILVVAFLLFGKRFPEIAGVVGRKLYQFRRGVDDLKAELSKPIRDQIEQPIREAAQAMRSAAQDAGGQYRRAALEFSQTVESAVAPSAAPPATPPPVESKPAHPFAYPGAAPAPENPPDLPSHG